MFTIHVDVQPLPHGWMVGGSRMSFSVSHDTTIADVKDKILMSAHLQRLVFAGNVLESHRTMADYNITAGAVIALTKWPYDSYNIGCEVDVRYHGIEVGITWDSRSFAILEFADLGTIVLDQAMMGTFQIPGNWFHPRCITFIYAPGPCPRSCNPHAAPHHLRLWVSGIAPVSGNIVKT
jgi:hypothetical protein